MVSLRHRHRRRGHAIPDARHHAGHRRLRPYRRRCRRQRRDERFLVQGGAPPHRRPRLARQHHRRYGQRLRHRFSSPHRPCAPRLHGHLEEIRIGLSRLGTTTIQLGFEGKFKSKRARQPVSSAALCVISRQLISLRGNLPGFYPLRKKRAAVARFCDRDRGLKKLSF